MLLNVSARVRIGYQRQINNMCNLLNDDEFQKQAMFLVQSRRMRLRVQSSAINARVSNNLILNVKTGLMKMNFFEDLFISVHTLITQMRSFWIQLLLKHPKSMADRSYYTEGPPPRSAYSKAWYACDVCSWFMRRKCTENVCWKFCRTTDNNVGTVQCHCIKRLLQNRWEETWVRKFLLKSTTSQLSTKKTMSTIPRVIDILIPKP